MDTAVPQPVPEMPVPEKPVPDRRAAAAMWRDYLAAHPTAAAADGPSGEEPAVECFGDSPALADELLALVLHGPKRATAALVADFAADGEPLPRIGSHWIACDGAGAPRAVLRSTELRVGPLTSVDDAFAWDEGEGDRSRDYWLAAHSRYFRRVCEARGEQFSGDAETVFERFRVVWPPEVAD